MKFPSEVNKSRDLPPGFFYAYSKGIKFETDFYKKHRNFTQKKAFNFKILLKEALGHE